MYPATLVLKGKANLSGSDAQRQLAELVLDEFVQVVSSFELNQIASLTYGEMVCDEIFEMLEEVLAHPLDHSPLCLQKALVITKHVLIYGSEKCVNSVWALGRYVNNLREYNTVLIAQQRQGPDAFWQRIKGGGVDKGFPVREAAETLHSLLQSREQIQLVRHAKADPNSLVPVGDDKIAFASDEVRHYLLKKRLEEQQLMHTKSNLKKERGGFGGGFQAKDGKQVVGAAHSLEEMIARANREQQKFSDDGPVRSQEQRDIFSYSQSASVSTPQEVDLLDLSTPAPAPAPTVSASNDLLGTPDLLGLSDAAPMGANTCTTLDATADLLSLMTVTAPVESYPPPSTAVHDSFAPVVPVDVPKPEGSMTPPVMGSNEDRFAALDALASSDGKALGSVLTGHEAQNRILGSFNLNETYEPKEQQALDVGGDGGMGTIKIQPLAHLVGDTMGISNGLSSIPTMPTPMQVFEQPNLSCIAMGATYGELAIDDDDENGFVMGGAAGSGLEPAAPPPAGAPPPPPPM